LTRACESIIEKLRSEINEEYDPPMERSKIFEDLPSRSQWPHYYQIIKSPISIKMIEKRVHSPYYHSIEDFKNDFLLMFNNATTFNMEESQVYIDALYLRVSKLLLSNIYTFGSVYSYQFRIWS
jgi:ATP-dependent helicase STH1/SNF2